MPASPSLEFGPDGLPAIPAEELGRRLKPAAAERFMTTYRGYANEWNVVHDQIRPLEDTGKAVPPELLERAESLKKKAEYWRSVAMHLVQRLDEIGNETAARHAIVAK